MEDRNIKGRAKGGSLKGEQNPLSRFTEKQIKTMRRLYLNNMKQKDIAKQFNTTQPVVSAIINKKYWKHI
jgi:DNA-binding MarR family transcriptional regulator